jgi:hypothetical protein
MTVINDRGEGVAGKLEGMNVINVRLISSGTCNTIVYKKRQWAFFIAVIYRDWS